MLVPGACVELHPEKAVVGGRMLARVNGEVVLVSGAIPGERVQARLERRQQGVWFAATVDILEASPDRRDPGPDPACGGMSFAHIAYPRQCQLKAALVAEAFARVGRIALDETVAIRDSPATGYRLRYRVHAAGQRLGFFREGTHEVCDPARSGQLAAASVRCLEAIAVRLPSGVSTSVEAFECIENLSNTERVVNLAMRGSERPPRALVATVGGVSGVAGVSWTTRDRSSVHAGAGKCWVSDPVAEILGPAAGVPADSLAVPSPALRRHAPAFFQANRYLVPTLARTVASHVEQGSVVDLYAGVGLFGVCLAALGLPEVTAIESDPVSAHDLEWNARPFRGTLAVKRMPVEEYLRHAVALHQATLIVDPPRTGMSRQAMQGIIAAQARRLVYVSCDVATLARDSRRLLDAGYRLRHVEAFDLFPNTPHVEGLAVFDRREAVGG